VKNNFAWSFSRLGTFETCPKKYYETTIAKNVVEKENEGGNWGTLAHDALKNYLGFGTPLPVDMTAYQKWADAVKNGPGNLLVEQKFALTKDFQPTTWMAKNVWVRIIGDAVRIWEKGSHAIALYTDWKTGGTIKNDDTQLAVSAQAIFSYFPQVEKIRTKYVWLSHDADYDKVYTRPDLAAVWSELFDRVGNMERAVTSGAFPPRPSGLCVRHCPVNTCPFWGRGNK
jgi:hypothetical protein